jgi:type I restriction enzyme S subunit
VNGWQRAALGEVAEIERDGVQPDQIEAGTTYVGLEHIASDGTFDDPGPVEAGELASTKFRFSNHHLLYGKLRPNLAKIACPDFSGICSTDILPIRPGPHVARRYLFHFLRRPEMIAYATSRAVGINLPRLSPAVLEAVELPLPPLSEQRRIADILDRADSLRAARRGALAKLDALTQAIFTEMFGDPVHSPKFPSGTIRPYALASSGRSSKGVTSDSETRIPIYGGNGVNGWATQAMYNVPVLVFGRVGQQCGNVEITSGPAWVTDNAIVVNLNEGSPLTLTYLLHAFRRTKFAERVKHLDLPFINQSMILDYELCLPALRLQQEYGKRVAAIEQLRSSQRASLAQLDALFASLQQRAFRGEL